MARIIVSDLGTALKWNAVRGKDGYGPRGKNSGKDKNRGKGMEGRMVERKESY